MPKNLRPARFLLLCGTAIMIPLYLFTAGNVLFSPWPLYGRSRLLLFPLTALFFLFLLLLPRLSRPLARVLGRREGPALFAFCALFFAAQTLSALALRHAPITDAEQCVTAARLLAETGAYETSERARIYFSRYPFNLGFVRFLAAVYRFFGAFGIRDAYLLTSLAAAAFFCAGLLASARLLRRLAGAEGEARLLLLSCLTLPFYTSAAQGYTDLFALPFPPLLLLLALRASEAGRRGPRIGFALLFALLSFFGTQLRATAAIAAVACLLYMLFSGRFRAALCCLVCLAAVCLPGSALVRRDNERHLGAENLEKNRLPVLHYLAMGLPVHEDEGYGQYGYGGWLIFSTSFEDPAERDAALRAEIRDRVYYLRYPSRLLNMLSRKNLSSFGDGTFRLHELIEGDAHEPDNPVKQFLFERGRLHFAYQHLSTAILLAEMLLACLACFLAVRRGGSRAAPVFITLTGAFLYLSLWETKARYFFMFQFVLLSAAALYPARQPEKTGEKA